MQSFIDVPLALVAWTTAAVLLAANGAVIFWAPLSRVATRGWRSLRRPPAAGASRGETDRHDVE